MSLEADHIIDIEDDDNYDYDGDYGDEEIDIPQLEEGKEDEIVMDVTDETMLLSKSNMKENDYSSIITKSIHNDENHKTSPIMTKYEFTKIKGFRLQQLASGAPPFVVVPSEVTSLDGIFELEFEQKKIPFIIRRLVAYNEYEYWKVQDLVYLTTIKVQIV
jgi:DNA-directed RNA polymerase I, II, and III subunit RPABC2